MSKFSEWLKKKNVNEAGLNQFMPNMGQKAMPMGQYPAPLPQGQQPMQKPQQGQGQAPMQPQPAPAKPQQISLSSLASKVKDPTWHQLHDKFTTQFKTHANDPKVGQLGQALYQAAQTGNMTGLQPFKSQYLDAQPMR